MPRESLLSRQILLPTTVTKAAPNLVPVRNSPSLQFINGRLVTYEDNFVNYIVRGYQVNDVLSSLVNMMINKASATKWGIYKVIDEQAYKMYRFQQSQKEVNFIKTKEYFHKALQPNENAGKWGELIENPNSDQDFNDLYAELFAFLLLTGNQYTWGNTLKAGANEGIPFELLVQPSQWMQIFTTGTFPPKKAGYNSSLYQQRFEVSEICHGKKPNLNYDLPGSQFYGMSPIKAGLLRLQKSNLQMTAEAASWQNEGIKGIIALKNQAGQIDGDVAASQVQQLSDTIRQEWSGAGTRGKMGASGYDLSWIPIGLNAEEMQLIASGLVDLRSMCNWYEVPSQLMNDPENKIYSNQKEGEKAFTSRCVVPPMCKFRDGFVRHAKKHWKFPKDSIIDFDLTYFPELQNDISVVVDSTNKLTAQIPNEQREQAGLSAIDNPIFNEPWVMSGGARVPWSERQMNDVDNALNEEEDGKDNF